MNVQDKLKDIVTNLKSIAKKDDVNVKISTDEIITGLYTVDITISKVKIDTIEKLIRVAYKYKECKTHEYTKPNNTSMLRLIFGEIVKGGRVDEGLKSFEDFNNLL